MQLCLILLVSSVLIIASEARHFYPYSTHPPLYHPVATTPRPHHQRNINDVTVVDEKTGIRYNPYSKHHPGRHVCANQRNVSYPIRTKRVFAKPTYKKYMVRCGTQWCEGVRLVYEKYHREVVTDANHTLVDYTCCPGWTQVNYKSHGCNKPVCSQPCTNGGKCVRPNVCMCPPGYDGTYCETKTTVYSPAVCPVCLNGGTCRPPGCVCPPGFTGIQCENAQIQTDCSLPCKNGGTCKTKSVCICPPGFSGKLCDKDVDECKQKPCDQICYNTPGSYRCECKESFVLQRDGQTCRKENDDDTALEAKDLDTQQKLDKMDKRLQMLEKMVKEKSKNEVTKQDLKSIYGNIDRMSSDIGSIACKLRRLESCNQDKTPPKSCIDLVENTIHSNTKPPSPADEASCDCEKPQEHPPGCKCMSSSV
ncbi:epidermal growth factor-like protein 8 isoform X2 [Tribolium castaneum]|uniref:epidermal growth factor-like protein 8 isoform X2 n=1 Tax=Tribolium castaneum TaxID=7070 RepID=UPI00046C05CC|nr:PREDICTED: epidermal growth factor-like protein 8 isoform X3 [Tribolium castaneum]|eukprot:XP_008197052.1 PREDICTED: epidermal growth factor-like protein 8 isoform X3 [Tribolium castaneum]